MPGFRPRYRSLSRPRAAVLLALAMALVVVAPVTAIARTVEFTSTERGGEQKIDIGLPDGTLGVKGKVTFSLNATDRQAAAKAKQQEQLLLRSETYQAASTEARTRIAAINRLLLDAQDDEARLQAEIEARMVERYKGGDAGDLEFLFAGDGLSDIITRGQVLEDQSRRDQRTIEEYEFTVARIEQYRSVLEELEQITGEQSQRLAERARRIDEILVAARVGHDEAPARAPKRGKPGIDGTWYIMDGAFQAQLFLPSSGSGYDGGTRTPARRPTAVQINAALSDPRIDFDASGMQDVATGQIDGRLLDALMLAARRFNYVKVTSLKSDHGVYTASGNVSAHSYGCAADIGTIGSTYITPGSQTPGGEVHQAVQFFSSLPGDLAPHQVISLFDIGGATLSMGDHGDHIHLGYSC